MDLPGYDEWKLAEPPEGEPDESDLACDFCDEPAGAWSPAGHLLCAIHEAAYWRHVNSKIDELKERSRG